MAHTGHNKVYNGYVVLYLKKINVVELISLPLNSDLLDFRIVDD